jgi:hypothetical protein
MTGVNVPSAVLKGCDLRNTRSVSPFAKPIGYQVAVNLRQNCSRNFFRGKA